MTTRVFLLGPFFWLPKIFQSWFILTSAWWAINSLCRCSLTCTLQLNHFMISEAKIRPFCTFILWKAALEHYGSEMAGSLLFHFGEQPSPGSKVLKPPRFWYVRCGPIWWLWRFSSSLVTTGNNARTTIITNSFLSERPLLVFFFLRNVKSTMMTLNHPSFLFSF